MKKSETLLESFVCTTCNDVIFCFCGITVMCYSAATTALSLVQPVQKRIDKPFANDFVEYLVLYSVQQSFHCNLFTINLNIYHFVCLEHGCNDIFVLRFRPKKQQFLVALPTP